MTEIHCRIGDKIREPLQRVLKQKGFQWDGKTNIDTEFFKNFILKLDSETPSQEISEPTSEKTFSQPDFSEEPPKLPDLSCVYASWNNPEQHLVDCARLLSHKGKIITMRYEACQKCFARRTFVKDHKQPQLTPQQKALSEAHDETYEKQAPPLFIQKRIREKNLIYCALKLVFRDRQTLDFDECKTCPNKPCLAHPQRSSQP